MQKIQTDRRVRATITTRKEATIEPFMEMSQTQRCSPSNSNMKLNYVLFEIQERGIVNWMREGISHGSYGAHSTIF